MKLAFTLCSNNYLAQAKTVGDSLIRHNPDMQFIIGLVDHKSDAIDYSFFAPHSILPVSEIGIPNLVEMIVRYDIVELNTAVKPFFFDYLFEKYAPELIYYFDPDIMIFDSIAKLHDELKNANVILTPHILDNSVDKLDNFKKGSYSLSFEGSFSEQFIYWELHTIRYGLYNLGFIGIANSDESHRFLKWWKYRTDHYCFFDLKNSLYVDQLWITLVPMLFNNIAVLKDPGCNVAHWNVHERKIEKFGNKFRVNGTFPLVFFHYSSFDSSHPGMLSQYDKELHIEITGDLNDIIDSYRAILMSNNYDFFSRQDCLLYQSRPDTYSATDVITTQPSTYVLGITNICNLHCPLCVTGLRQQKKNPQFMEFNLFRQIIDKIRPYAQQVQLYKWGESLLHPQIVDMLELCDSFDLNTEISSNLNIENSDRVLEALVRFRLRHLIVSFDGVTQEDYARYRVGGNLSLVLDNLRKIKEYKIRYNSEYPVISLQFLRNKFTGDQVHVIEENYRRWGADRYYVCDMTTVFKDRDLNTARQWFTDQEIAQRKFLDIDVSMHEKQCDFLFTTMIIEQDGSIPSCCFATDPKDDFGRWDNSRSILEMFNSDRFVQARRMFREKRHSNTSTCDDCCVFTTYLGEEAPQLDTGQPKVSVIIPSYNRAKMLGITIESFVNQDYPRDRFEIIIADNNSTDNTREVVADWQSRSAVPITYLFEQRQGVHFARNSAAKIATGEILYFTDDDMIATSRLLAELVTVFERDPLVGTATGRVLPKWECEPPEWILKLCYNGWLSIFDPSEEGIKIKEDDPGVYSCHQAIRRDAFFRTGGFNPESTYTDYIGDGETGLNIKLKALGYKFGYNSKSLIHHMIPPSRMTQDYLNKRMANQGSADCYTEYKKNIFGTEELLQRIASYQNKSLEHAYYATMKRIADDIDWHMDEARTHYYLSRIGYDLRLAYDPTWRNLVLKYDWINE